MAQAPHTPALQLPKIRHSPWGGLFTSVLFHGVVLLLVWWTGRSVAGREFRSVGGIGPEGGGGGGGGSRITYIELPPYVTTSAPTPAEHESEPAVQLPIPKPNLREIPTDSRRIRIAEPTGPVAQAAVVGVGPGSGGGEGAGTGSGGGVGSGQGTGVGSGVGPGTGGSGGDGYGPRSRQLIIPPEAPPSVKGKEFKVRFWIDERGRVTRIEVDPRIPDASYRREFNERMREFRFYPAKDASGNPIPSFLDVFVTP